MDDEQFQVTWQIFINGAPQKTNESEAAMIRLYEVLEEKLKDRLILQWRKFKIVVISPKDLFAEILSRIINNVILGNAPPNIQSLSHLENYILRASRNYLIRFSKREYNNYLPFDHTDFGDENEGEEEIMTYISRKEDLYGYDLPNIFNRYEARNPSCHMLLKLKYLNGKSYNEISEIPEFERLNINALTQRMLNCRNNFRNFLTNNNFNRDN
jgi:hypothetical protein